LEKINKIIQSLVHKGHRDLAQRMSNIKSEKDYVVTVHLTTANAAESLQTLLKTIQAVCDWGASRSVCFPMRWIGEQQPPIPDQHLWEELERKGFSTIVGFDGDGSDKIEKIVLS